MSQVLDPLDPARLQSGSPEHNLEVGEGAASVSSSGAIHMWRPKWTQKLIKWGKLRELYTVCKCQVWTRGDRGQAILRTSYKYRPSHIWLPRDGHEPHLVEPHHDGKEVVDVVYHIVKLNANLEHVLQGSTEGKGVDLI